MGDVQKMCDICGVVWNRSKMRKDADGLWRCPDDMKGRSFKEISEGIARRARNLHKRKTVEAYGRLDTTCKGYSTNPQEIMGNLLLGWWNFDAVSVGGSCDAYNLPLEIPGASESLKLYTRCYFMYLAGHSPAEVVEYLASQTLPNPLIQGRSGVTLLRNRAQRYDHDTIESNALHISRFGDLSSESPWCPIYDADNDAIQFESYLAKATRRLSTPKGEKILGAGDYPCVWVVFKPTGNNVISSVNPDDHGNLSIIVQFQQSQTFYHTTDDVADIFRLGWGDDWSSPSSSEAFWNARTVDTDQDRTIYGPASLNTDSSWRVWSARHEEEQLVLKVSDQEWTTAITSGGLAYDMDCMVVGNQLNGQIKEIVLTSDVPTATQISQLESYFKAQYSDIVETL